MLRRFGRWLHLDVPAGSVEPGPDVGADGTTNLPRVFVVGDLTGIPLLKFACDSGAAAVDRVDPGAPAGVLDLVIVGAGVAGMAAALEAKRKGLSFRVLESSQPFATIANFPKGKPIFAYPAAMRPRGALQVGAGVKEELLAELEAQVKEADLPVATGVTVVGLRARGEDYDVLLGEQAEPLRARHVIVALGRSGNFRRLGVVGEDLPKVYNRLHDPARSAGQDVLVVGGGDSALEGAAALADAGARVTLSYRGASFSRPKPENVAAVEARPVEVLFETCVREVRESEVVLDVAGRARTLANDSVFPMIGREPPLDFFRRSGIPILGEMTAPKWRALAAFVLLCTLVYAWKAGYLPAAVDAIGLRNPASLPGSIVNAARAPGFYYTLAYTLCIIVFGIRRVRRRRTPYVKLQTWTLAAVQVGPLFLLPQILLPWMGANGWVPDVVRSQFFPGDEWWRAYGLVLAWPLFFWNLATDRPLWGWLIVSLLQTFVVIPLLIRRWGKGAYCGWICSCGALAETMGDAHRQKMWHGPLANRWNLAGQVVLAFAFLALAWRAVGWILPDGNLFARSFGAVFLAPWKLGVDVFLAGILGVGLYFWFSGRVWCRFFCPLAALMHIYAKFTRYRIFSAKDKCISCNVCTTVCHQGIDVMNYANKGTPMSDVECVRCSACVQECPTGTLVFGTIGADGGASSLDGIPASPVHVREEIDPSDLLASLRPAPESSPRTPFPRLAPPSR